MKKRMNSFLPYLLGASLLTLVACGSDDDDNGSGSRPQEQQETIGSYKATLSAVPLNSAVAGSPTGTLDVVIEGDEVRAVMNMQGVPGGMRHAQNIMVGTSCPTESADINNDKYIDILEGVPSHGLILVPLDGDIEDQDDGSNGYPMANAAGNYTWTKTASLSRMIADLQDADIDLEDGTTKLEGNELNLAGKVVIVHGVKSSSNLPDSVATVDDFKSYESLPIACGKIERVASSNDSAAATTGEAGATTGEATATTGEATASTTAAPPADAAATTGGTTGDASTTGQTTTAGTNGEAVGATTAQVTTTGQANTTAANP